MRDGLVIGLDLCDNYSQISCMGREEAWVIPTVICKMKNSDLWAVGEEAYAAVLTGEGILVDKLLQLMMKDGTATLEGVKYGGLLLLQLFLEKVLNLPKKATEMQEILQLVISVSHMEAGFLDQLMYCADYLKVPRERVHIISRVESFVYYILSQKRDMWNNQVGMFELAEDGLRYYELKVQRGLRQTVVTAECENLDEGFNLNILSNASGIKLADKILCSCGERLLKKKIFSSIVLTGKGFEKTQWASDFMKLACDKRKVYLEPHIFSIGAAYKAADFQNDRTAYPYVCICDGRLQTSVSTKILHNGNDSQLVIAAAGDPWYDSKCSVNFILDNQKELELMVTPLDAKNKKIIKIPLENFPERPNRTTKIEVVVGFLDVKTMVVLVKDKGFGELFPASEAFMRQEVML